ncbi:DUF4105 domain-containing protein [Vibrio sp. SCSIO 43136]|nr:DUF4105 domain-containing protein [Vibrio sp. SCSIO 43136]
MDNGDFFISSYGDFSAENELKETIYKFVTDPSYQCEFPARLLWVKQQLPQITFPDWECADYSNYVDGLSVSSISVVYASGYLGNPASMYGHVLLKLNSPSSGSELLDNTYSYGAVVPEGDNKFEYILKGIFGGYKGHFSNQKYHHQSLVYNQSELRDLWEYQLNLTQEHVDLLVAHLWELRNTDITYYFFEKNCAYQLAKLLELVIDEPLVPDYKVWVMPYDIIMMLNNEETQRYVRYVKYHPSRQESLYNKYEQLTKAEQRIVEKLINSSLGDMDEIFSQLNNRESKRVIDVLYDYYAFLSVKNSGLTDIEIEKRKKLLVIRFSLDGQTVPWKDKDVSPPHTSQRTAMLQGILSANDEFGSGYSLRFRANYYDLLNINSARIPNSELATFDMTMFYSNASNSWSVRELTLFNIVNLNASQTGLPGDHSNAWSFNAGYKPTSLSCLDCSDMYLGGFLGKSKQYKEAVAYLALAGELQFSDLTKGTLESGPELGGVLKIAPNWVMSIKMGSLYNLKDLASHRNYLKLEQRFFENQRFDMRASVQYQGSYEYAISLSTYW